MKVLYILMRTDLPSMTTGRAAAQASHASNAFIHKYGKRKDVKEWQNETPQGFGTAIVLGIKKNQIHDIFDSHKSLNEFCMDLVYDPEYGIKVSPEIYLLLNDRVIISKLTKICDNEDSYLVFRNELTCAYLFGDKEKINDHIPQMKELVIYP